MPTHHNIELRSEEIQELLTKIPSVIIRWGITVLFFCTLLLLAISVFIKIPEKIHGDFLFDSSKKGEIYIPVTNSGLIKKGQRVTIAIDNFPSSKFGTISTMVDSLYFDEEKKVYIVHTGDISTFQTTYGLKFQDLPYMSGKASILIAEERVINRLLPFLSI